MASSTSSQVPPFYGYVETTGDALRLIQAARCGIIPRITRRLTELERPAMIRSGAVFVFSVEESGIKRWTEGLQWSPSRIAGNFLLYKEVKERATRRGETDASSGPRGEVITPYKPHGLCKKTITVKIDGSDHHLVSYFTMEDFDAGRLRRPTSVPDIMALVIPPELIRSTNFRYPPQIEAGPDGRLIRIRDVEDINQLPEDSPRMGGSRAMSSNERPASVGGTPSPTSARVAHEQNPRDSMHIRNPIPGRSMSQHGSISTPPPPLVIHEHYRQSAHRSASTSKISPHSPQLPPYPPFKALPTHPGNPVYPAYASASGQSFGQASSVRQQGNWGHEISASHAEGMSTVYTGQHALSGPVTNATWATQAHPLLGQYPASEPTMPSSIAPSLPAVPTREHMPTRSTTSTWALDQSLGSQHHALGASSSAEVDGGEVLPASGASGYRQSEQH